MAKKLNGKQELERLTKIVEELHQADNDLERAILERKAGCKLYSADQMKEIFLIEEVKKPYWYGRHKNSGAAVILTLHSRRPELYKVFQTGRQALQRKGVRYSKVTQ